MKKLLVCMSLVGCLWCIIPSSAIGQTPSSSSEITAVSDTTDEEETSAAFRGTATDSVIEYTNSQTSFNHKIDEQFNFGWKWFENLFNLFDWTGGSFFFFFAILFFLILLAPLAILILLIILLVKVLRRKNNVQLPPQSNETQTSTPNLPVTPEEQKDKSILLMALGAGFSILCLVVGSDMGIGIGLFIVCIGVGKWVIANRHLKRNKNENQDK